MDRTALDRTISDRTSGSTAQDQLHQIGHRDQQHRTNNIDPSQQIIIPEIEPYDALIDIKMGLLTLLFIDFIRNIICQPLFFE